MNPSGRTHTIEWLIRAALAGLLFLALLIVRPGILAGTVRSWRAMTLVAVAFGVAVALEWLLRRAGKSALLSRAGFYVPMAIMVAIGVIPSFITRSVHEDEPDVFRQAQPASTAQSTSAPPPTSDSAVVYPTAQLRGVDHRASGDVRVAQDRAGRLTVRFESLDVEPGPDYFVYLIPGAEQEGTDNGTRLGKLQAPQGDQNYEAPAELRLTPQFTVLIWCRAFAVPVALATIG